MRQYINWLEISQGLFGFSPGFMCHKKFVTGCYHPGFTDALEILTKLKGNKNKHESMEISSHYFLEI
jgi:hypothetical protein